MASSNWKIALFPVPSVFWHIPSATLLARGYACARRGGKPFGARNVLGLPARGELALQREVELIARTVEAA